MLSLVALHTATVKGAVLASDAFFPFAWGDSVEKACQAGIKAIAHPGGSIRDQDTIDCCNKYGAPRACDAPALATGTDA